MADKKIVELETFREMCAWEQSQYKREEPSCWNGIVSIRKYRITVEEIDEPQEVLRERLLKLWRECDNHHHYGPLRSAAKSIGYELPSDELGKDRKRRR